MTAVTLKDQLACAQRWLTYLRSNGPKFVKRGDWTQERLDQELAELTAVVETVERRLAFAECAIDWEQDKQPL